MAGLLTFLRRHFTRSGRRALSEKPPPPVASVPAEVTPDAPAPTPQPAAEATPPLPTIERKPPREKPKTREPLRAAAAFSDPAISAAEHDADAARALIDIVTPQALRFDIPPSLLFAIIAECSHFDPTAETSDGAWGLMHVRPGRPSTAALKLLGRATVTEKDDSLLDAATNIELGAACIHLLDTRTFKDVSDATLRLSLVLTAYLAGQTGKPASDQSRAAQPDNARAQHILARVADFRAFDATFDALADE